MPSFVSTAMSELYVKHPTCYSYVKTAFATDHTFFTLRVIFEHLHNQKDYKGEEKIYWLIVNPFQGSNMIKVLESEMYNLAFKQKIYESLIFIFIIIMPL